MYEFRYNSLGSDDLSLGKFLFACLMFIVIILVLPFFTVNIANESLKQQTQWYTLFLGYGALIVFIADLVLTASKRFSIPIPEVIDVVWYERQTAFGVLSKKQKIALFVAPIFLFFLLLTLISWRGSAFISVPTFQLIRLGIFGSSFMIFLLQILEELIFVGFVAPTIYASSFYFTKNRYLALALMFVLSPAIFTLYHFGRYGTTDMLGSMFVFLLNLVNVIFLYIFRNVFFGIAIHGANNVGVQLLNYYKIDPFLIILFSLGVVFFVFIILILIFNFLYKSKYEKFPIR